MKALSLSIVIPVFNESHHIDGCLRAIQAQTLKPDQVVIVDNNCTDDTIEKAKKYKFVTIVNEKTQGMIPARNKGFNSANSDILARIDADARVEPDWVKNIKKAYENPEVSAVGGVANTNTISETRGPKTTLWSSLYLYGANAVFRVPIIWGANMSIRRSAWNQIKDDVCLDDSIVHEDQDIALLLAGNGLYAIVDKNVLIRTSGWSYHTFPKLLEYTARSFGTKNYHKKRGTLKNNNANVFPFSYSVLVLIILAIPTIFFYSSSFLYYFIGPFFRPFTKKSQ